jgi:FAT domain
VRTLPPEHRLSNCSALVRTQSDTRCRARRELLATELVALVGESYSRAYPDIVRAQQCTELSEVLQYLKLKSAVGEPGAAFSGDDEADGDASARDEAAVDALERMRLIRDVWCAPLLAASRIAYMQPRVRPLVALAGTSHSEQISHSIINGHRAAPA